MRVSPTVLAFIAASGLVGLSSSQAKADPLSDAQTASAPGQESAPTPTDAPAALANSAPQAQPLSLEDATQADNYAAESLSLEGEPSTNATAPAGPQTDAAQPWVAPDPAEAIRALREQIHQHRTTHQVDPADWMAQQESEEFDAVPSEVIPAVETPTAPTVPAVETPSVPAVPEAQTPTTPDIPAVDTPTAPTVPAVETPGVPAVPEAQTPTTPDIPAVDTPTAPAVPEAQTPTTPDIPAVDTPTAPAVPEAQTPTAPAVPELDTPTAPDVPEAETPSVPAVPGVETPTAPEVPGVDTPEGELPVQEPGPSLEPAPELPGSPGPASPGPTDVAPGNREAILENASELSPEQIERIREAAEEVNSDETVPTPPLEDSETTPDEEVEDPEAETEDEDAEAAEEETDPRVLVAEVQVEATTGDLDEELRAIVYDAVETLPGRTTTRTQLQQDINNIFATGFFAAVDAVPEDTDLGVRVTYLVQPNPILTEVQLEGNEVLPQEVADEIFADQTGEIINLIDFQDGILDLNQWYQDRGYVLAQVVAAPQVSDEGVVTLEVAEGVIEEIEVRFLNEDGDSFDEEGNPIDGRTRDFIVTREFSTEPGDVFNQSQIEQDFQNVFALQIFEDVSPGLEPGDEDPRQVKVIVNVTERNTGSVAAGLGFNFTGDLFGTVSFRQDNFGGNNQKLTAEAQLSTRDIPVRCLLYRSLDCR
jgi:hypothetical protein